MPRHLSALPALALALSGIALAGPLKLHVPSPDWRDQVIYFVMTDRFDDGDPRNNDQGAGEFDPRGPQVQRRRPEGHCRRLDYVQGWAPPPCG
jgi:hypothetical protein